MTKAAIVSSRFNMGHRNIIVGYYDLLYSLGYDVCLYLEHSYLEFESDFEGRTIVYGLPDLGNDTLKNTGLIVSVNVSQYDLPLFRKARKMHIHSYLILHEPYSGIARIIDEKPSLSRLLKMLGAHGVAYLQSSLASTVILPSQGALGMFERYMSWTCKDARIFSLVYPDEGRSDPPLLRDGFSYIGTFVPAHSCEQFLDFMRYAAQEDSSVTFRIATKSSLDDIVSLPFVEDLIRQGRLVIQQGRTLTTGEMEAMYQSSGAVWCAYTASSQSGVIVDAMRNGCPAIATRVGDMERCVSEGASGEFVSSASDYPAILAAYKKIETNIDAYSEGARRLYRERCWWKAYVVEGEHLFGRGTRRL